jgi:hypothetical protein
MRGGGGRTRKSRMTPQGRSCLGTRRIKGPAPLPIPPPQRPQPQMRSHLSRHIKLGPARPRRALASASCTEREPGTGIHLLQSHPVVLPAPPARRPYQQPHDHPYARTHLRREHPTEPFRALRETTDARSGAPSPHGRQDENPPIVHHPGTHDANRTRLGVERRRNVK